MKTMSNIFFIKKEVIESSYNEGRLKQFLFTTIQLFFILATVFLYKFETENHLNKILPVIFIGFIINEWLPMRYKMLFFYQ